jgi:cobalt-zinc-cadmium efflux system protein
MINSIESLTAKPFRYYHHNCNCYIHSESNTHNAIEQTKKVRLLWAVLFLVSGFAVIESIVGFLSHSLALLADSSHMFADALALGVALLGTSLTKLPLFSRNPSLQQRAEALAALVNGISLLLISIWIGWEALMSLQSSPPDILNLPMLMTAVVGLMVNAINIILLHGSSDRDLNMKGAFLHVVADAVSSIGVILAAFLVWTLHWTWADGVISLLISLLIILSVIPLLGQSLNALNQKVSSQLPETFSVQKDDENLLANMNSVILNSKVYSL